MSGLPLITSIRLSVSFAAIAVRLSAAVPDLQSSASGHRSPHMYQHYHVGHGKIQLMFSETCRKVESTGNGETEGPLAGRPRVQSKSNNCTNASVAVSDSQDRRSWYNAQVSKEDDRTTFEASSQHRSMCWRCSGAGIGKRSTRPRAISLEILLARITYTQVTVVHEKHRHVHRHRVFL